MHALVSRRSVLAATLDLVADPFAQLTRRVARPKLSLDAAVSAETTTGFLLMIDTGMNQIVFDLGGKIHVQALDKCDPKRLLERFTSMIDGNSACLKWRPVRLTLGRHQHIWVV